MATRILIATDCFLPRWDGIARFLVDILPGIKDDFEITIVAPDFPGDFEGIDNVKTVRIPLMKYMQFGDYTPAQFAKSTIKELVETHQLVFVQTLASIGLTAMDMCKKLQKPYIMYVHSIDWQLVTRSLAKHNIIRRPLTALAKSKAINAYKKAHMILVPSQEVAELLRWHDVKTPIQVVKLGIDTDHFVAAEEKKQAKEALGIDGDTKVIGYVGRLSREKDILTLYRAFLSIHRKVENVKLLVVGDGILEIKDHMKNNRDVIMIGASDNVLPYIQAMDIYVLTSLLETTSLSTLEAMSCEVAVCCTPVGLVKEYIKEKHNGLLFPKQNSTVLGLKIEWLLREDFVRNALGIKARNTVLREYNIKDTRKKIKEILQAF